MFMMFHSLDSHLSKFEYALYSVTFAFLRLTSHGFSMYLLVSYIQGKCMRNLVINLLSVAKRLI